MREDYIVLNPELGRIEKKGLVIPLQLEEASKGIALIQNPTFHGIMLSLWISPLVASVTTPNHPFIAQFFL